MEVEEWSSSLQFNPDHDYLISSEIYLDFKLPRDYLLVNQNFKPISSLFHTFFIDACTE